MKWMEKLLYRIIGFITWFLVLSVFGTYKVLMFGREIEENFMRENPGKGVLLASWHRGLFFFCYFYRNLKYIVMLSASKDADLFARAIKLFGWIPVRGSSSRRGSEALHEMQDFFEKVLHFMKS
ncbi:DUF374 domain-containing protein, partial [candidate division CSSED10-310 bacterium]